MDINKLKKRETKTVQMAIRTYPSYSKFLKAHKISPTALFQEAVKDLMKELDKKGEK